jgi:predicted TIM-barrel fold metal-dependent hydrolase
VGQQAVGAEVPASSRSLSQTTSELLTTRSLRLLFGSDWPVITPDRWLADFAKLEIREEIRPKVLKANARRLLGI